MSPDISERSFEEASSAGGPDACAADATAVRETPPPYGDTPPAVIASAILRTTTVPSACCRATRPGVLEPASTKGGHGTAPEELETRSRIIADLNERFGLKLGPEHRVTLGQMMEELDDAAALDAAARVNTRENVRLTIDQEVKHVIQEIVDSNFDLYKRMTDDRAFGEAIKNFLVVSCQRSPEPVFLKWKGMEASPGGDFFVRSGPGTVKLPTESANEYIRTRFGGAAKITDGPPGSAV